MSQFTPNQGADEQAGTARTALAASKMRLFKSSLSPDPTTTLALFEASEADYDGYAAGGIAITNFSTPIQDPDGGYSIESGLVQFTFSTPGTPPVTNTIGGWFLCLTGGELYAAGTFNDPLPMEEVGDGIPVLVKLAFGEPL